jgi:hypothetical protein
MFSPANAAFRIVIFALIILPLQAPTVRSSNSLRAPTLPLQTHLYYRREIGNSSAAGDLYGVGLRSGAYLTVAGMLLSCLRSHKRSRVGIHMISGSVSVALLLSCSLLLARKQISPCEAWLVLCLIHAFGAPRWAAINESERRTGGRTGVMGGVIEGEFMGKMEVKMTLEMEKKMTSTGTVTVKTTGKMTGGMKGNMKGEMTGRLRKTDRIEWRGLTGIVRKEVTGKISGQMKGKMRGQAVEMTMDATVEVRGEKRANMIGELSGTATGKMTKGMRGEMMGDMAGEMTDTTRKTTGGIPLLFCLISIIWHDVLLLWFWATIYRHLPLLNTSNRVWFFVEVDISGWFRTMMFVYSCINCVLFFPVDVVQYVQMEARCFAAWSEGKPEGDDDDDDDDEISVEDDDEIAVSDPPAAADYKFHFYGRVRQCVMQCIRCIVRFVRPLKPFIRLIEQPIDGLSEEIETWWSWSMEKLSEGLTMFSNNPLFAWIAGVTEAFHNLFTGILDDEPLLDERRRRLKKYLRIWRLVWCFWGFSILILTIAGVEKIIQYNALSPDFDLSQPGQIIPLVLGIIVFIDGASNAIVPVPMKNRPTDQPANEPRNITVYNYSTGQVVGPSDITSTSPLANPLHRLHEEERAAQQRAAQSLESTSGGQEEKGS